MSDVSREEFDALVKRVTALEGTPPKPTGLQVKATSQTNAVKVEWVPTIGKAVSKFEASRNGQDVTGHGAWTGTFLGAARTCTFDKLLDQEYKFTVKAFYQGGDTETLSIAARPLPKVVLPPVETTGGRWLSGPSDGPSVINQWGTFRDYPATYSRTWTDQGPENMMQLPAMAELARTGWEGVLDLAIGGPFDWYDAAQGGNDDEWRTQCRKARDLWWPGLKQLHLSMAHEFNNGYMWQVGSGEQGSFREAWGRWHRIVREELVEEGKDAKVVLSCNSDTNGGWTIASGLPDPSTFDILGCDFYSMWPALPDQATWDANYYAMKGDTPRGMGSWRKLAKDLGRPISFPEWGLNPGQEGNEVDNPFFIEKMNQEFRSMAPKDPYNPGPGELAGEAYFNNYDNFGKLYPSAPSAPNSRAKYLSLSWGK